MSLVKLRMDSDIASFYSDKSVFVTGATGFVGKVLVEKLLRSCPSIVNIYILIREKRNESASERLKKYLDDVVFSRVNEHYPKRLKKLILIDGDVSADNLGISEEHKSVLINNVRVIFHCAAIVKFDEPFLNIAKVNVKGTHEMLQLAKQFKQLKSFVYISTAFSQSYQFELQEKFYPTGYDVFEIIKLIDDNDSHELEKIRKALKAKKHPSVYTMSKALAEELVYSYKDTLPVSVVRPGIIAGASKEPHVGFVCGLQTFTGLALATMTGLHRSCWANAEVTMNMIPVDFTVNTIIAVSYSKCSTGELGECSFITSSAPFKNSLKTSELLETCSKAMKKYPPRDKLVWYPEVAIHSSYFMFLLHFVFTQLVLAMFVDCLIFLSGNKVFLTRLEIKIYKACLDFRHFATNTFNMDTRNSEKLFQELNEIDQIRFNFDCATVNPKEFTWNCIKGIRKFMFKEDESTVHNALVKLNVLFWINSFIKILFTVSFICVLLKSFGKLLSIYETFG